MPKTKKVFAFIFLIIGFLIILSTVGKSLNKGINWNEAEAKWQIFAQYHLEKMREIDATTPRSKLPDYKFDKNFRKIDDPLITKYLPNYQIYQEFDSSGNGYNFALRNDGHIIDIGNNWPIGYHTNHNLPDFEIMNYSDFIKNQDILVSDSKEALEMINLGSAIYDYKSPRKDYQKSWKLNASKDKNSWFIGQEYLGDPNDSRVAPSSWLIDVDSNNHLTQIRVVMLNP